MSPQLFNIYMDGVVMEINMRMLGSCLSLQNADNSEWKINQLLFAEYTALVVDSRENYGS